MRRIYQGLGLGCFALLAACTVGPNYQRPAVDTPAAYRESGDWEPAQPHDVFNRGAWWTIYDDPVLDALEKQIDVSNQNLKASEAAYQESLAVVEETRAQLFPTVGVGASAVASGSFGSKSSAGGKNPSVITYALGPTASWAPDVWGRIGRAVEANEANAEASAADLAAARLSAQAMLATDYFDLRVQDDLRRLLDRTVADDSKILTIVENQYKVGVAAKADVLSAQTQLESVESQDVNVGVKRAQLEHAIAMLTGRTPSEFALAPVQGINRIPNVPGEVPSTLLERRPDIAAGERAMIAANAEIGVAEAAWYPDITLSASVGYTATALGSLMQASNSLWTIGPSVNETLFDAGAREAAVEQAEAGYAQTVALYRQTVLTGFQQVEDELAAQRILGEQQGVEDKTVADSRMAEKLTLNEYQQGVVAYNSVLTAQITTLTNEQTALTLEDARLDASAALIQALGGGWDISQITAPPPETPEDEKPTSGWFHISGIF